MHLIRSFYGKLQYIRKTGFHGISKEKFAENAAMGGHAATKINKELNRCIFNEEFRKRQHKTLREKQLSSFYDPIQRHDASVAGGKKGYFTETYYKDNGIDIAELSIAQSIRGKKGGKKNIGSRYYKDDTREYKYMHDDASFENFLNEHPEYKKGRITTSSKNKIWVNDGIKNFMKSPDFDTEIYKKGKLKHDENKKNN
jgi:hypothetical protein